MTAGGKEKTAKNQPKWLKTRTYSNEWRLFQKMFNHLMIALANPLQLDEAPSVAITEHLQKCVCAKAHNKLGYAQRANKIENVYMLACEKIKNTTLH